MESIIRQDRSFLKLCYNLVTRRHVWRFRENGKKGSKKEIMRRSTCLCILGLKSQASTEAIREAYRKGVKRFHPDTSMGDPWRYMLLQRAYTLLRDGGPYDEEFEEDLRRAGFESSGFPSVFEEEADVALSRFEFPDLERTPSPMARGVVRSRFQISDAKREEPVFRIEIPSGATLSAAVLAGIVRGLLERAQVLLPPVNLLTVAKDLNLVVEMGTAERDYGRCNRLVEATVHTGRLTWRQEHGVIRVEGLFNADRRLQRYVLAKMIGYALLVPGKDRSEILGELYGFHRDPEDDHAHRFAEELLLPEDLVSIHGGRVLGFLAQGRKLSYEAFLLRMEDLFDVPSAMARKRLAKYESRLRILLHLLQRDRRRGFFDICEEALY